MTNNSSGLIILFGEDLEEFVRLSKVMRHFETHEQRLKKMIQHCPIKADKRLFEECLDLATRNRIYTESLVQTLLESGRLHQDLIEVMFEMSDEFEEVYELVKERSVEILKYLEKKEQNLRS